MRAAAVWCALSLAWAGCSGHRAPPSNQAALSSDDPLLPSRVRRLSNAEYERAASDLLGIPVELGGSLPPDLRQDGFTLNAEQTVAPAHAKRLGYLADELSRKADRWVYRE
jgi:hypothetical protein